MDFNTLEQENTQNGNGAAKLEALELRPLAQPEPELQPESKPPATKAPWHSGSRGILLGLILGAGLAFGGSQLLARRTASEKPPTPSAAPQSIAPAQSVTIAEVKLNPVSRTLTATGSVTAFELLPVMSQASGLKIEQILAAEGDYVKRGQTLVRLNNDTLQAQLVQARAGVAQAEARVAELRAGSRSEEIARAKESVRSAQAGVRQAESDLNLARQRAQRNRFLQAEGAIARDRLDEILNVERNSQAALAQARARLQEARQQLAQVESGPRPETIAQAEAQLAQSKGQVQLIASQLNQTRVVAPASGKIATRNARVGDLTSSSNKLFEIIQNGRLEVQLKVPETQLAQIRPGQSVQFTSDTDGKLNLTGTVREIDPTIDPQSRQALVKVDLPEAAGIKPGMFLRGAIVTSATAGLTAPTAAILPQADGSSLAYAVQPDNTVKVQSVQTGKILPDGRVEIKSGLNSGDRIVLKGAAYLKEGDRVEIKN